MARALGWIFRHRRRAGLSPWPLEKEEICHPDSRREYHARHLSPSLTERKRGDTRAAADSGGLDERSSGASLLLPATALGKGQKRDADHRAGAIPHARRADPRHAA